MYNLASSEKNLGMHLDTKLDFQEHLDNLMSKVDKTIGLLRKLQAVLLRTSLVTTYKAFVRPHLDYWDIIYGQGQRIYGQRIISSKTRIKTI